MIEARAKPRHLTMKVRRGPLSTAPARRSLVQFSISGEPATLCRVYRRSLMSSIWLSIRKAGPSLVPESRIRLAAFCSRGSTGWSRGLTINYCNKVVDFCHVLPLTARSGNGGACMTRVDL